MDTVTCPKCGHINSATVRNCEQCQINLAWAFNPQLVEKLLQQLKSKEAYTRKSAAEEVARWQVRDETLVHALKTTAVLDSNKYVRKAAEETLHTLGYELSLAERNAIAEAEEAKQQAFQKNKTSPRERVRNSNWTTKNIKCPECGKDDKLEKVSAILARETHEFSGGSWETEVYVDKKGKKHSEDHYVPYSGTQKSVLAQRLSPPSKPNAGLNLPNLVGIILLGLAVVFIFMGLCGVGIARERNSALAFYSIICGSPALVSGAAGVVILMVNGPKYRAKLAHVQQVEIPRWERVMERWNQLYYCSRDDCVFIPSTNQAVPVPVSQMRDYLYEGE